RSHARLGFTPGLRAAYTNLGYLVLGEVIAAVSGVPYPEYVRDHVLRPLGMGATDFSFPTAQGRNAATQYQRCPRLVTPVLKVVLPPGIVDAWRDSYVRYHPFLVNGAAYGGLVGSVMEAAQLATLHLAGGTR